ncbi:hypothetical protein [Brevibacillus choshinensis]|uniref:hypothetical protein n=1 Tax=Brevibacillus choshinensis TaxID=54911 RepID=UPI002E1B3D3F|nr:hypothetical protein [Brevibacillus choshinensis]
MTVTADVLLERLLQQTITLQTAFLDEDADPEKWVELLESRDAVMEQLNECLPLNERQVKVLHQAKEINDSLHQPLEEKHRRTRNKLDEIQKAKSASYQYNNAYVRSEYGAFFDMKK